MCDFVPFVVDEFYGTTRQTACAFAVWLQVCYKPGSRENSLHEDISPLNSAAPASILVRACENQDKVFSSAFSILENAISEHAFPGASVAVTRPGQLVALKAFGHSTYERTQPGAPSFSRPLREGGDFVVTPATAFDLASVSKVIATTAMAMLLYERGMLDLEAPLAAIIPEFISASPEAREDPRRREITLHMLLAHSSGLPAYEKLFLKASTRDQLLHAAFITPLTADPGSRAEYSDIGFIILGAALERLSGESLDRFCQREIFGPLRMSSTAFNPPPEIRTHIPPTVNDRDYRRRIIQGEVHDENASVLGGVAGHAGVFSTAEDVARFAHAMLNGGRPILHQETVSLFTRREQTPEDTSRALGWDTPSRPSQSGKHFSAASFGHLGYTGTSLWIDPERQLSVTLLTNRTWPDCSSQAIKTLRPRFHDAVMEALEKSF